MVEFVGILITKFPILFLISIKDLVLGSGEKHSSVVPCHGVGYARRGLATRGTIVGESSLKRLRTSIAESDSEMVDRHKSISSAFKSDFIDTSESLLFQKKRDAWPLK